MHCCSPLAVAPAPSRRRSRRAPISQRGAARRMGSPGCPDPDPPVEKIGSRPDFGSGPRGEKAMSSHEDYGARDFVDTQGHVDCCLHLEVGWSPRQCPHFARELRPPELAEHQWQVVAPVERVTWEGGTLDCSTEDTVRALLPSTFVQHSSDLRHDVHGPSWLVGGEVVMTNYASPSEERGYAFLARADWLASLMRRLDMELVLHMWYERWRVSRSPEAGEPWEEMCSTGRIDTKLRIHASPQLRKRREKAGR